MKSSTKSIRKEDVTRNWYEVNATDKILGRLAAKIAVKLMGKDKPIYTPHIDGGDFVVVTNADKFAVTGTKMTSKNYYRHSQYPGGLKTRTLSEMLEKKPEEIIRLAVKNMLPKNKLGSRMINRLKVYTSSDHTHTAQNPTKIEL